MELEKIKEITAEILNISTDMINEKSSFYDDLGADSLDFYKIITDMEDVFDVNIADSELSAIGTVGDALDALHNAR